MDHKRLIQLATFIFLFILPMLVFGCNAGSTVKPEAVESVETVEPDPMTGTDFEAADSEIAITETETEKVIVNVNILRLRSGPGTDYEILDRLEYGTVLTVIAEDIEWLQVITPNNKEGWVHGDYVTRSDNHLPFVDEAAEETCKTLRYLGMSKEEIVTLYGEPDINFEVPGPGGDHYFYNDLPVSFIFAGQTDVVNNLSLKRGAQIRDIKVGMTLKEIEEIWGNADSKGYDEGFDNHGRDRWYAVFQLVGAEYIEVYIFFKESDGPSVQADVLWKSFR
jgi:hypothetical protein